MKQSLFKSLIILVSGRKSFVIPIDDIAHIHVMATNQYDVWETDEIVFDCTHCHPEYVLDMLALNKGNIDAMVRSLHNNEDAVWMNRNALYTRACNYIVSQDGACDKLPCFSCPGSYLENDGIHCTMNGFANPVSIFQHMRDGHKVESANKYLSNN